MTCVINEQDLLEINFVTRFGGSGERGCIGVGTTTLGSHLILEVGSGSSPRELAWQTPLTPALTGTCFVSFLFISTWKSSPLDTSNEFQGLCAAGSFHRRPCPLQLIMAVHSHW